MHHPFSTDTLCLPVFSFAISCIKTRTSNMAEAHFRTATEENDYHLGSDRASLPCWQQNYFYLAINAVGHIANPKSICVRFASAGHHTAS